MIKLRLICISLFLMGVISCKDDPPRPVTTHMNCKIDGVSWSADSITYLPIGSTATIYVTGHGPDSTAVELYFPRDARIGTYEVSRVGSYGAFYRNSSESLNGDSGEIIITKENIDDQFYQGSFKFIARSVDSSIAKTITSGNFLLENY